MQKQTQKQKPIIELRNVWKIYGHPVSLLQPKLLQPSRKLIYQTIEFAEGHLFVEENQGRVVGILGGGVVEHLVDGDRRIINARWYSLIVLLVPRSCFHCSLSSLKENGKNLMWQHKVQTPSCCTLHAQAIPSIWHSPATCQEIMQNSSCRFERPAPKGFVS